MTLHSLLSASPFVGRDRELADIAELLSNPACRLLTLVGPGGIGKTRLALEAARLIVDDASVGAQHAAPLRPIPSASFPNGVHFVPLQPLSSPDFMVSAIADAIGLQFFPGSDPKQQLLDYLREKAILLVLDNVEHLLDGAILVSDILAAAPEVCILATSRERLNLREEWVLEVGGLDYPANEMEKDIEFYSAVELFVQHARRSNVNFTLTDEHKPAIIHICHLVGGMPLGIELAAAWVRALSCEAIADEIARSLDILETPARNVEPRHRTMRAAFEPTWKRLSEQECSVFMKLSVFRSGFTREAAEYVAGASLQTLTALVDKSLIRMTGDGRYDLHELLRQYGEEQLKLSGEIEAMRDSHSAYYAAFLQQKWQPLRTHQQVRTLDEIEAEFDNVCAAWQTMAEKRKTAELSMAVYPLWYYSDLRGRYHKVLALFQQAENALRPTAGDKEVDRTIGQMLTQRGFLHVSLGKPGEGRGLAEQGLAILQQVGTPEELVMALDSLCLTSLWLRDLLAQQQYAEQAVRIARHSNDRWLLARAQYWLSDVAVYSPEADMEEAWRKGEEALALAETCGDLWLRALASGEVLGGIAMRSGNYIEARQRREQSLMLFEELGQVVTIAQTHWGIGVALMGMNDYSGATNHYRQSLKILVAHGSSLAHQIRAVFFIADVWCAQDNPTGAIELFTLGLHHSATLPWGRSEAEQRLLQLQAELPPETFAAAQERGKKLELRTVVQDILADLSQPAQVATSPKQPLTNPLTEREREILCLIAEGMSNREIADQLVLAVSTVKWYVNEIFGKLHVTNRTQAVARARALGWLS